MDGVGPERPKIMLVMDVVNQADDEMGEPGHGDQGNKLRYLLKKAGLKRKDVHVTYALRCKPWNAGAIKTVHIKACQKHLLGEILEVKPKIVVAMGNRPIEMLLGEKATKDFRGYFWDIDLGRKNKFWVMPTYGMNGCLMRWEFDELVVHDLLKAKEFVRTGQFPKKLEIDWEMVTDMKSLRRVEKELVRAKRNTYDFETTGLKFFRDKIVMAGFCPKPGRAIIIPFFEYDLNLHPYGKVRKEKSKIKPKWDLENIRVAKKINKFVKEHREEIRATIRRILRAPSKKNGWNIKFDDKFARVNKFRAKNWTFDGIIAHALVDENKPHSLTFALEWYGINHLSENCFGPYDQDLWSYVNKDAKTKKPYSFAPPLLLASYLAKDVDGAERLRPILKKEMEKENVTDLFKEQQMPLVKELADFEYRGIMVDIHGFQDISKRFGEVLEGIEKKLKKMVKNKAFNSASPQQVLAYFEKIDAPLEKKTKGGENFSTDKKVLEQLSKSKRKWGKFSRLLIQHREITKLKGTYLDGKDGQSGMLQHTSKRSRVHTTYNPFTPRTGRLSSREPNLQNIPRPNPKYPWANIRQLFITTNPKWPMFSIDYKQIEMRVAAYLSREMVMIKEIRANVDLHTRNAVTFGKKLQLPEVPDDMTEKKFAEIREYEKPENYDDLSVKQREKIDILVQQAGEIEEFRVFIKSMGFGLNYGMEAYTLATEHDRDVDEVQEMIDAYFKKYWRLFKWRNRMCDEWLDNGVLILPWTNRKRRMYGASEWFNSRYSQDLRMRQWDMAKVDRQAMNFPVQGFANEIFTRGKLKLLKTMRKEGMRSKIMLTLHDGVLGEGPKDEMKELLPMAKETMEKILGPGKKYEVPLGIDFDLYDKWSGKKLKGVF